MKSWLFCVSEVSDCDRYWLGSTRMTSTWVLPATGFSAHWVKSTVSKSRKSRCRLKAAWLKPFALRVWSTLGGMTPWSTRASSSVGVVGSMESITLKLTWRPSRLTRAWTPSERKYTTGTRAQVRTVPTVPVARSQ
ncbi:hypothetical protein D7X12_16180 [Corallococcus sicarius]|uniref:Uncharacterized protein n=1 Tax=Corallococcus sicarius TaxID=2316726 RepID=A0A3A8NJE5_9BACT|nr:hypothetical protein D7X12_16180 [Corallococcus sicarius]